MEIYPYLGSSRMAEVVDRHGANVVVHGHAHRGALDGKTTGGVPVYNVALTLMQQQSSPRVFRVSDVESAVCRRYGLALAATKGLKVLQN